MEEFWYEVSKSGYKHSVAVLREMAGLDTENLASAWDNW